MRDNSYRPREIQAEAFGQALAERQSNFAIADIGGAVVRHRMRSLVPLVGGPQVWQHGFRLSMTSF
jgi:hypothetical protein